MRGPGTEAASAGVESVDANVRTELKDGKRPTPFVLTVVATGANHSAFFRNKVKGQIAFNGLLAARKSFLESLRADPNHQEDYTFDDCSGTRYIVSLREFKSAQLADVMGEHWANADRKLAEAYVATDFQQFVQKHHAGLTLLRAQPGPGNLIRPGN